MNVYYDDKVLNHNPRWEFFNGERINHADQPARVSSIVRALREFEFRESGKIFTQIVSRVHLKEYLAFLERVRDQKCVVYPSVFFERGFNVDAREYSLDRIAGRFGYDMYTPFSRGAVEAAYASASSAVSAARSVMRGGGVAYALCRPPGHHTESGRTGGYCYLNNAACAAEALSQRGKNKVAILDFDYHHGNGTQEIFYNRNDIFFASLHAHPEAAFPHFAGFKNERGEGKGRGYNLNMPLDKSVSHGEYLAAFGRVLRGIRKFNPRYLVLSAGFDIHRSDPIGGFRVGNKTIVELGKILAGVGLPTVVVQEGGYNSDVLGSLVRMFLEQFE